MLKVASKLLRSKTDVSARKAGSISAIFVTGGITLLVAALAANSYMMLAALASGNITGNAEIVSASGARTGKAVEFGTAGSTYNTLVNQDEAIAYWPLHEQGGTVAVNTMSTSGANNGTLVGTAGSAYTLGVVGRGPNETAYRLNGGYVDIGAPSGITPSQFSVSGWMRIPSGQAENGSLYASSSNSHDGFGLNIVNGVAEGYACVSGGSCATVTASGPDLEDASWHMLTLTKSGSNLVIYVDGAQAGSTSSHGNVTYAATPKVTIGSGLTGGTDIDDVSLYSGVLTASDISTLWPAGACPQSEVSDLATGGAPPGRSLPGLPLTTDGRFIVDGSGSSVTRVKLASVNWYGFEEMAYAPSGLQCQPLSAIVHSIVAAGFNSVRLPWSTDSWNSNPVVPNIAVAANPSLRGMHLRNLMDAVINELGRQGIMVILDNHDSRPDWCCTNTDGNALWWEDYNPASPPAWSSMTSAQQTALYDKGSAAWQAAWANIVTRYSPSGSDPQPAVIGADLRNEPRDDTTLGIDAVWGGTTTPAYENWQQAATSEGDAILGINPNMLIMVEGVNYGTMFGGSDDNTDLPANASGQRGAEGFPVKLSASNKLVYSAHNYEWDNATTTQLGQWWAYLLTSGQTYTAPVWVGEFGTCSTDSSTCLDSGTMGTWWQTFMSYLGAGDIDWSYWSLNGTGGQAVSQPLYCNVSADDAAGDANGLRFAGCSDTYGVLNDTWQGYADPNLVADLQKLEPATQKP